MCKAGGLWDLSTCTSEYVITFSQSDISDYLTSWSKAKAGDKNVITPVHLLVAICLLHLVTLMCVSLPMFIIYSIWLSLAIFIMFGLAWTTTTKSATRQYISIAVTVHSPQRSTLPFKYPFPSAFISSLSSSTWLASLSQLWLSHVITVLNASLTTCNPWWAILGGLVQKCFRPTPLRGNHEKRFF